MNNRLIFNKHTKPQTDKTGSRSLCFKVHINNYHNSCQNKQLEFCVTVYTKSGPNDIYVIDHNKEMVPKET